MYYEEKIINGILMCKTSPSGEWKNVIGGSKMQSKGNTITKDVHYNLMTLQGSKPGTTVYLGTGLNFATLTGPDHAAHAALIVRAVNAHDDLIRALENLLDYEGLTDKPGREDYAQAREALKKTGRE